MDPSVMAMVEEALAGRALVAKVEDVTTLWAGYGSIKRLLLKPAKKKASSSSSSSQAVDYDSLILKQVAPPAGSQDDVGHQRKIWSYVAERAFYASKAPSSLHAIGCSLPQPLHISAEGEPLKLLMTDLSTSFPSRRSSLDWKHAAAALSWLARFHAYFWESPTNTPRGLWEQGGYWHLSTRMNEFNSINGSGKWAHLKKVSQAVDLRLRGHPDGAQDSEPSTSFRTLVHGDPKAANMVFSSGVGRSSVDDGLPSCAMYDFQYVGGGYGVVDVVYVLATSVDRSLVEAREEELLALYYKVLHDALKRGGTKSADEYTREVFQEHYELALVDWLRFMAGWGMWGNAQWVVKKVNNILRERSFL